MFDLTQWTGGVLMMLGAFEFSLGTATYQEFRRTTEYRWPSQERIARGPALQWVGPGEDAITLEGVLYPDYWGGPEQLDALRTAAAAGAPQMLVAGTGVVFGQWVVERIEEHGTVFHADGRARKIEFTLGLKRYWDDAPPGGAAAGGG